jgi:2-polyprenyl-3-methyl-5-hydroxy-6-metoxy-1,4-benzoquinol methylase
MRAEGWDGTALDPDERAVRHARQVVGVRSIQGDFLEATDLGQYDVVSFNKVLEHVRDPVAMLTRAAQFLRPGGFVYVEVPDGEAAVVDGPGREEFFIDHHHVFSMASLALLAVHAGFRVRALERLQEPSTKYTLRAFLYHHA